MKSIYELAVEQMQSEDIDHHRSDLYLRKTPISDKLVESYEFPNFVSTFKGNIDKRIWYEIPFAYNPFWSKEGEGN